MSNMFKPDPIPKYRKCSSNNINTIFLILGPGCNFNCRYCLQTGMTSIKQKPVSEEVLKYVRHLIKIRPDYQDKLRLMFWGGEPLLYMDGIRQVVARFRDNLKYSLVTNGSLLTPELAWFLNANSVDVIVSNDGRFTRFTRNTNILDNPDILASLKTLDSLQVECVTSAYSYDYKGLLEYFKEKLGDVVVNIDFLKFTWEIPEDLYDIPFDEYESGLRRLAAVALDDFISMNGNSNAARVFQPYVDMYLRGTARTRPACGAFYHTLNIDCDGNVYACHNTGDTIGHISDERLKLLNRYREWLDMHARGECGSCEVNSMCAGGCPLDLPGQSVTCRLRKIYFNVCKDLAAAFLNSFEAVDWSVAEDEH